MGFEVFGFIVAEFAENVTNACVGSNRFSVIHRGSCSSSPVTRSAALLPQLGDLVFQTLNFAD
jgi:hypothetical protein